MYKLLFTNPRTGSTSLSNALNSLLKDKRFINEPFHPYKQYDHFSDLNLREELKSKSLDEVIKKIPNNVVGFKYLYGVSDPFMRNYDRNIIKKADKVVFLERKNVLKSSLSLKIAYHTGKYQVYDDKKRNIKKNFYNVDIAQLEKLLNLIKSFFSFKENVIKEENVNSITVSYKDLYFKKSRTEFKRIINFLDISSSGRKIKKALDDWILNKDYKLNSLSTFKKIENIQEIEKLFGSDEFGHVL